MSGRKGLLKVSIPSTGKCPKGPARPTSGCGARSTVSIPSTGKCPKGRMTRMWWTCPASRASQSPRRGSAPKGPIRTPLL